MALRYLLSILFSFCFLVSNGQQGFSTSAASALANNGSITYTIGQVVYTHVDGSMGSANHGVHHPDPTIVTSLENHRGAFKYDIFPNPTMENVWLKLRDQKSENVTFELYHHSGKLIESAKLHLTQQEVKIEMKAYDASMYILKIISASGNSEVFKIIKY